jgi:hypothetical protein
MRLARRTIALATATTATILQHATALIERERSPDGLLVRTGSTRGMALWVMVMLVSYLVLYYV